MTRLNSGWSIGLLVAVALASVAFAFPAETVDFSLAPQPGLKFKVSETQEIKIEGKLSFADAKTEVSFDQTIDGKEVFTQTIKDVKDGKVVEVEREYEDAGQKVLTRTEMFPEPEEMEQPSPIAWKHVRAFWKDDEFSLVVKHDDVWEEAEDDIKRRLSPRRILQPKMPFPAGPRRVGESWELSAKDLKDYFADTPGGGDESEAEVDGSARFKFVEVTDKLGPECAVIEFEIKIKVSLGEGPIPEFKIKGKLYYAIQARVFYGMKTDEGTMRIQGEETRGGHTVGLDLNGTLSSDIKVKVLVLPQPEKKEE